MGQALLPVSQGGAWHATSQARVPAPLHQPLRDGWGVTSAPKQGRCAPNTNADLYSELVQKLLTHLDALEGRNLAKILLDEEVLHAAGGRGRKNPLPVDYALPHLGEQSHPGIKVG